MDEYTADAFANRDEPVPLLTVTYSDAEASSSEAEKEGKTQKLKRSLSPARLKEKAQDLKESHAEKIEQAPPGSLSIQDRLFARFAHNLRSESTALLTRIGFSSKSSRPRMSTAIQIHPLTGDPPSTCADRLSVSRS